ncbi:MAG: chorismate-binding protein, partial [Polyangiaceae bacterium]
MLAWAKQRLAAPEVPADAFFVVLTARASAKALERFLPKIETHEGAFFWAPGTLARAYDDWTLAGTGAVLQIEESGADRFSRVQAAATRSFAAITEWSESGVIAPRIRLFGGASFHPSVRDPLWAPFGDASFVLPRFLYGVRNDDAFFRFAFRRDELSSPNDLLAEIARMESGEDFQVIGDRQGASSNAPSNGEVDPAWRTLVTDALAAIREKVFDKVVVARRSSVSRSISVPTSLQRLLRENPESTTFACVRNGSAFLGASPERLIFVDGEHVITEALAGTIARGADDEAAKRALFTSDKDRREHQIVVDGITAAISPFSSGIDVAQTPTVRTLGRVHHLATSIVGRLD